jgi:hypothetical protein
MSDDTGAPTGNRDAPGRADAGEALSLPDLEGGLRTILCPVDGSEGSETGLAWASLLAGISGGGIVVVAPGARWRRRPPSSPRRPPAS